MGLKLFSHLPRTGWETHGLEIQRQPHQPHRCVSSGISATAQGIVLPTLGSLRSAPWADFWDTLSSICCCSGCTGLVPFQESGIKPRGNSAWKRIRHHLAEKNSPSPSSSTNYSSSQTAYLISTIRLHLQLLFSSAITEWLRLERTSMSICHVLVANHQIPSNLALNVSGVSDF